MKKKSEPKAPREHTQVQSKNQGIFKGRKWVKRAHAYVNYICYNIPSKADEFVWET